MQKNRNLSSPKRSIAISDSISSDSYQYSDYYDNQEDEDRQSYKSSDDKPPTPSNSNPKTPLHIQPSHINRNITPQSRRPLPKSHQQTPPSTPQITKLSNDLTINTITKSNTNTNIQNSSTEGQTTPATTRNSPTEDQNTTNHIQNSQLNSQVTVTQVYPSTNPHSNFVESNEIKGDSSGPLIMDGQMSFQITYDSKITYWKRPLCMTNNDKVVYCCKSTIDQIYGKVHIISTNSKECRFDSQFYCGMIVRHKSGSRFTLLGKPNENRKVPQLAGIAFFNLKGKERQMRSFRLALPTSDKFYDFNDKEKDLSRIALKGVEVDGVEIYSTSKPEILPNHKLFLDMGPYEKKRSLKNFMIKDKNDSVMFIIFKVVHSMCKVKAREPIKPIVAFALSVAAITSLK